ncbi:MAG: FtsQ-type POTRA domain-containing protein [Candidatus Nanopelagicales bacterium]
MTVVESAQRFGAAARTRRVWRWVAAAVVLALVALGVWVVWFSSLLTVKEVRVLGTTAVSADQVRQAADVPARIPLARVDADGIAARVGAIPRVASVEVRRGWPDVLVVVVTERTPLVVVADGSQLAYLDATGAKFGEVSRQPATMPLVSAATDAARASSLAVVAALPDDLRRTVDEVRARTIDDVVLVLRDGSKVQWGNADRSDRKAAVLRSLLTLGAARYDVSAPDLPTTSGRLETP